MTPEYKDSIAAAVEKKTHDLHNERRYKIRRYEAGIADGGITELPCVYSENPPCELPLPRTDD